MVRVQHSEMVLVFLLGCGILYLYRGYGTNLKEIVDMFSVSELKVIAAALVVQEKSVLRLAAKEGQPESVAAEYRKVATEIQSVLRKAVNEQDKIALQSQVKK